MEITKCLPTSYQGQSGILVPDEAVGVEIQNRAAASCTPWLADLKMVNNIIYTPDYFIDRFTKLFISEASDRIKEVDTDMDYVGYRRILDIDKDAEKDLKDRFKDRIDAYDKEIAKVREQFMIPGEVPVRFTFTPVNSLIHEAIHVAPVTSKLDRLVNFYVHARTLSKTIGCDQGFYTDGMILDPERTDEYNELSKKLAQKFGIDEYQTAKDTLRSKYDKKQIKVLSGKLGKINKLGGVNGSAEIIDTYSTLVAEGFMDFLTDKIEEI